MDTQWRRASGSPRGDHPIEVSEPMPGENVAMRLGRHDRTGWSVPIEEWHAFLDAVKAGEFDDVGKTTP